MIVHPDIVRVEDSSIFARAPRDPSLPCLVSTGFACVFFFFFCVSLAQTGSTSHRARRIRKSCHACRQTRTLWRPGSRFAGRPWLIEPEKPVSEGIGEGQATLQNLLFWELGELINASPLWTRRRAFQCQSNDRTCSIASRRRAQLDATQVHRDPRSDSKQKRTRVLQSGKMCRMNTVQIK